MNKLCVLGVIGVSLILATGALAEILGGQPGTSNNPKDNVPKEIQRGTPGGEPFGPGGTGPGNRSNALAGGMEKEKPEPVTQQALEQNAEQGGGAATAAEVLKEESIDKSKRPMTSKPRGTDGNDGPKTDRRMAQQQESEKSVQGQDLINKQPMDKQQPANRPASERGAIGE